MYLIRGGSFRKEYNHVGEVRSLIPAHVNVMALTATATRTTRERIIAKLCMEHPFILSLSPHKKNVAYFVKKKSTIEDFVQVLAKSLAVLRTSMPKTIIFCKRYDECSQMYKLLQNFHGKNSREPPGAPDRVKYLTCIQSVHSWM